MRRGKASRYGRYAGGPDPLAPPIDMTEALEEIAEDVMAGYSPERAMREYLRRFTRYDRWELSRRVQQRRRTYSNATAWTGR